MTTIQVVPNPGRRVRQPETGAVLPENGAAVPHSIYWVRRELAEDVSIEPVVEDEPNTIPAPAPDVESEELL